MGLLPHTRLCLIYNRRFYCRYLTASYNYFIRNQNLFILHLNSHGTINYKVFYASSRGSINVKPANLIYIVEEKPHIRVTLILAIQHLLIAVVYLVHPVSRMSLKLPPFENYLKCCFILRGIFHQTHPRIPFPGPSILHQRICQKWA